MSEQRERIAWRSLEPEPGQPAGMLRESGGAAPAPAHRALLDDLARLRADLARMQSEVAARIAFLRAENERLAAEKATYEARVREYKRILSGG